MIVGGEGNLGDVVEIQNWKNESVVSGRLFFTSEKFH